MVVMSWRLTLMSLFSLPLIALATSKYGTYYEVLLAYTLLHTRLLYTYTVLILRIYFALYIRCCRWCSQRVYERVQNSLAHANRLATEVIGAMRTVRSFAAERSESRAYTARLQHVYDLNVRLGFAYSGYVVVNQVRVWVRVPEGRPGPDPYHGPYHCCCALLGIYVYLFDAPCVAADHLDAADGVHPAVRRPPRALRNALQLEPHHFHPLPNVHRRRF